VARVARREFAQQLSVVVQHFFEVRNHPLVIDGIAGEPPGELVVDTALGHARQCEARHVQGLISGLFPADVPYQCRRQRSTLPGAEIWGA